MRRVVTLSLLLAALLAGPAAAAPPPLWDKLETRVREIDRRLDGVLGLSVRDIASGATMDIRAAEPFPTASSIKLAVLDARRGDENVATPGELRRLMEAVQEGVGLGAARAADLRLVAGTAESSSHFRAALPEGTKALTKSGELEGVRCEVAYVDLPGRPYSAAIMTKYLRRDSDGTAAIRELSALLFDTFDRLARSSEYGRIISER